MSEHTPGPWRLMTYEGRGGKFLIRPRAQRRRAVALTLTPNKRDDSGGEEEANARLIAAAPELLEALNTAERRLSKMAGGMHPPDIAALHVIRAAIAKAEGSNQ